MCKVTLYRFALASCVLFTYKMQNSFIQVTFNRCKSWEEIKREKINKTKHKNGYGFSLSSIVYVWVGEEKKKQLKRFSNNL